MKNSSLIPRHREQPEVKCLAYGLFTHFWKIAETTATLSQIEAQTKCHVFMTVYTF